MYPLVFFSLAILVATVHYFLHKPKHIIGLYLQYLILFCVGLQGIYAWYGHAFMPVQIAEQIGWPQSPFQFEVAVANLAFGVLGVLAFWFSIQFKLATVIGYCIFMFGAAFQHIVQMGRGDYAQYNSGIFLYGGDIVIPGIILLFMILTITQTRGKKSSK